MILTSEEFWCPRHGRLPQDEGICLTHDEQGNGPYIPFYAVRCKRCVAKGAYVCRGNTDACRVMEDFCVFHQNHVGQNPFPHGQADAQQRAIVLREAEQRERNNMGLWDGQSSNDDGPWRLS